MLFSSPHTHFFIILENFILSAQLSELKTTVLYFYSALAQSMAALFAVSGIFLIFRIQIIHQEISKSSDNFREWVKFRLYSRDPKTGSWIVDKGIAELGVDVEPDSWLVKDILDHIDYLLKKAKEKQSKYTKALTDYFNYINSRKRFEHFIKLFAFPPFLLTGIVFLNALYSLSITDYLVKYHRGILFYDITNKLILCFAIIIYLLFYILYVIKGPKDSNINNPKTNKLF